MSSLLSELMTSGGWMLHAGRANKPCGLGDHPTPASQSGGTPGSMVANAIAEASTLPATPPPTSDNGIVVRRSISVNEVPEKISASTASCAALPAGFAAV
jgi:hypothetical protein